ncbi:MAG: aminopeptidase [Chloroflexi bacterium]|nr:aminopeptidase [Chloroflexota bacterium]
MSDNRLTRLASLLVNYSTAVKPGDWVGILGDVSVLPALREVYAAVVKAGGNPSLLIDDAAMQRIMLREGSKAQFDWLDPALTKYFDEADVYIRIGGSPNTRAMSTIPGKRVQELAVARRSWLATRLDRAARGEFRWVGAWYPNEASAQEANLSIEEYADFVYGATFCDQDDPIARWQQVRDEQEGKVAYLKGKDRVVLKGPNIDLSLSIKEREFVNCAGARNMPDGEIFTGPVEDSVNGWVRFSYPSIVGGRAVSGIGDVQGRQGGRGQRQRERRPAASAASTPMQGRAIWASSRLAPTSASTVSPATSCLTRRSAARCTWRSARAIRRPAARTAARSTGI